MTKLAYLECPTGISGDMCLGALVDVGVPLEYLTTSLKKLGIADEFQLRVEQVHRNGQRATKVHVDLVHVDLQSAGPRSNPAAPLHSHSASEPPHTLHAEIPPVSQEDSQYESALVAPDTHSDHSHLAMGTRHLPEIERLIQTAGLPDRAETWSLAVFRRLAEAEAAVHGIPPEKVHFHEVGATDAIVDIVGTCLGLDWLGIDKIYCSALPTGGGTVRAAHGRLPVPAPAVLKLWEMRQIPIYSNGIDRELVTPTGAAIATTLATQFGPPPSMRLLRVGLGAGTINLPLPNILRMWIGEQNLPNRESEAVRVTQTGHDHSHSHNHSHSHDHSHPGAKPAEFSELPQAGPSPATQAALLPATSGEFRSPLNETIAVLETQIDDLSPQAIAYASEQLFAAGALDVFTQPIGMKKSRSGILLTVICQPAAVAECERILFQETTTLGIRHSIQQRRILHREMQTVETAYGPIRVKVARVAAGDPFPTNVQPEYEDCAQIARQQHLPWREVHRAALQSWYAQQDGQAEASSFSFAAIENLGHGN